MAATKVVVLVKVQIIIGVKVCLSILVLLLSSTPFRCYISLGSSYYVWLGLAKRFTYRVRVSGSGQFV